MNDSTPDQRTIEASLGAWERQLAELERQAAAVLKSARHLRKAAREGSTGTFPAAVDGLRQDATRLSEALERTAEVPDLSIAAAFEDGRFVAELAHEAATANVRLVQRDGRITAYPFVLRLEARSQGVRIGRRLERRIRPSFLVQLLKSLQGRPNRFNARSFLDRLLRAYTILAPGWQPGRGGEGPLVALADLHEALTLWPAAAADYPLEEFLLDLLRLNHSPDARTGRGLGFELGGSTGTKGAKRLSAYDETGAQHDFYAIRFVSG
jgi:hypothetical protein